jgi:hypothetical protein
LGWLLSLEKATTVLQTADSPDGRYRAEVVRQDPGVTSSYKYMVRVAPSNVTTLQKSLSMLPFAPICVALTLHRDPDKILVSWSGPQEVTIRCEECRGVPSGGEKWRDVTLKYEVR